MGVQALSTTQQTLFTQHNHKEPTPIPTYKQLTQCQDKGPSSLSSHSKEQLRFSYPLRAGALGSPLCTLGGDTQLMLCCPGGTMGDPAHPENSRDGGEGTVSPEVTPAEEEVSALCDWGGH